MPECNYLKINILQKTKRPILNKNRAGSDVCWQGGAANRIFLHKLGYKDVSNELFAEYSWYFRNALVRANYEDLSRGIYKTNDYLYRFLANLILHEKNTLKNRELHIHFVASEDAPNVLPIP